MDTEGKPEKHPELARLERLQELCQKRMERAERRFEAAERENYDAWKAHDVAAQALLDWIDANPDPQRSLFDAQ